MHKKYTWRTAEKTIYPIKKAPSIATLPTQTFITISGSGNPNSDAFGRKIAALYAVSYAIRMAPKKASTFLAPLNIPFTPWKAFGRYQKIITVTS